MSLSLAVGLAGPAVASGDPAWAYLRDWLDETNRLLREHGLPEHDEPVDGAPLELALPGYRGLHRLRRLAAHLAANEELPPPEPAPDVTLDPAVRRWYDAFEAGGPLPFEHLMAHSDHDGVYVPVRFDRVLHASDESGLGEVGSSVSLLAELEAIEPRLGDGYAVEAETCAGLLEACRASVDRRALLLFT